MCTRTDIEDRKRAEGGLQRAHDKIKTLKPPSRISRDYCQSCPTTFSMQHLRMVGEQCLAQDDIDTHRFWLAPDAG
jgi:hypothetical protein